MAEVYAGFISYTDDQIGRLIDYLEESGQLDNTDHRRGLRQRCERRGRPERSVNENKFFNGIPDSMEDNLARIDELGGPSSYNHYPTGWAWAFDTPFPYWKRFAGYEGGTADLCLVSWPNGIAAHGENRDQYMHAVDVVPTLYDLLDIEVPETIKGYPQTPLEGESFAPVLADAGAEGRQTQFYSMLGMRALYHEGWLANTLHPPISGWSDFEKDTWELYHLAEDRSQSRDLAEEHPERLEALKGLWWYNAGQYKGLPLDDRSALEIMSQERPSPPVTAPATSTTPTRPTSRRRWRSTSDGAPTPWPPQ